MLIHCLKLLQIIHDDNTAVSVHQQIPCTRKNVILGSWLIACCSQTNVTS